MSGYVDEPKDLPEGSPYWYPISQDGYWIIQEREIGRTGCRTTVPGPVLGKRVATALSGALNDAYRRGVMLGWREAATAFVRIGHVDPDAYPRVSKTVDIIDQMGRGKAS
jgi:hypothetical protein